jgi:protein tyrosine phosphatase (PTP) superfamily phosphohydrolase (DUF442 family)
MGFRPDSAALQRTALHLQCNARHVPITLAMKTSKNVLHFLEELKHIENRVAWFLAELCKAEKGVQKDK